MLVSGLCQRLARTICQHPLAAPRVPRGCSPKGEREEFGRISLFRHSLTPSSLRFLVLSRSLPTSIAVPVDSLAHICFSLSSIYCYVFALSISLSTHLCVLFRPLSLNDLSLLLLVSLAVCLSPLSSVTLCSLSSPSLLSLSLSLSSLAPLLLLSTLCFPPSSFLSAPSIALVPPLSSSSSTPSLFVFIFSYFSPPPLSHFSSIFFLYSPLDPLSFLANKLEQLKETNAQ